jgi:hypothetical protein
MDLKSMLASWQPTAAAIITAFFGFVLFSPDLFAGVPWLIAVAKYGAAGGLVTLGLVVKQHNVTGGTVANPPAE